MSTYLILNLSELWLGSVSYLDFVMENFFFSSFEAQRRTTYLWICAPSEDSDQPAHSRSLIGIFTRRLLDSQLCKVSSRGQRRLWSERGAAQANMSLSFGGHVRRYGFSGCGSFIWFLVIKQTDLQWGWSHVLNFCMENMALNTFPGINRLNWNSGLQF